MLIFQKLKELFFGGEPSPTEKEDLKKLKDKIKIMNVLSEELSKTKKPKKSKVKVEGNANLIYTKDEMKKLKDKK